MPMSPRAGLVALLLACAVAAGCAEDNGGDDRARERITALQQQWVDAVADGDVDTIVDLYAEDAWFLPAGSPPLQGRAAIREWWENTLADPPWQELQFGPTEIVVNEGSDWAYDVGSSRTVIADGEGESVQKGKYLIVWQRNAEGDWRVAADAFNGN